MDGTKPEWSPIVRVCADIDDLWDGVKVDKLINIKS
jgi:hypothetical protein